MFNRNYHIIYYSKRASLKTNGSSFICYYYLTAFLSVLPGVNPGAFLAAKVIFSPVLGFLPTLDCLLRTEKVPKPVITTFSPLFSESLIVLTNAPTASADALFVRFAFLATISMRSFLFRASHLPLGK